MKRLFFLLGYALCFGNVINTHDGYGQSLRSVQVFSAQGPGVVSIKPLSILLYPEQLTALWTNTPVPVSMYTSQEIALQQELNRCSDWIISSAPKKHGLWTAIDEEPITPYTWKWVDFTMKKSRASISLRRPNWWLIEMGINMSGDSVFIDLPDRGLEGWAIINAVRPNQVDTRLWESSLDQRYSFRPVTGVFIQESFEVYDLYLKGETQPIGVTGKHPIWSNDRMAWVEASRLVVGETIKGYQEHQEVDRIGRRRGKYLVYNIEVYRDHNYFVSKTPVLVHNICWAQWEDLMEVAESSKLRNLTGHYKVQMASEKVNETYRALLYYIAKDYKNPAKEGAGHFSDAMEEIISQAKSSGAKKLDFVVNTVISDKLRSYFNFKFMKTFDGVSVELVKDPAGFTHSYHIKGDLDKIKRVSR